MKDLFSKLSQLQALGYALGCCKTTLQLDKNLTEVETSCFKECVKDYDSRIFDLQHEIIDFVNNLNGKKVY